MCGARGEPQSREEKTSSRYPKFLLIAVVSADTCKEFLQYWWLFQALEKDSEAALPFFFERGILNQSSEWAPGLQTALI